VASVNVFTAERMQEIEDTTIVGGLVDVDGNLLLQPRVGDPVDAGYVRGPAGRILSASAVGLPTGATPTVTLGGTSTDRTMELGLPTGPQGVAGDSAMPAGTIALWHGDTAPTDWLLCDGAAVSRTTYASLWNALGTKYGAGNGTTTFNVPNLKGRVPVGKDSAQTEFDAIGETGGAKTASHTQSHTHTLSDAGAAKIAIVAGSSNQIQERRVTVASYANTHSINSVNLGGGAGGYTTASTAGAGLGGSTDSESVTTTVSTLQPYHVVNFIIKHTTGTEQGESELAERVGTLESQVGDNVLVLRDKIAKLQRVLSGGGVRKVEAGSIAWSQRFIAIGSGVDDYSPGGYFNIEMPPDGTVIPLHSNATTSQTVSGGRIPIPNWASLYYDPPLGSTYTSDPSRFHLVSYTEAYPYDVPPQWILIATRNIDSLSPSIMWGDGRTQDYWRTITMSASWVSFGGVYNTPAWKFAGDGAVVMRGLVKSGSLSTSVPAFTFPAGLGPAGTEIFQQASDIGQCRVDIRNDGGLLMYGYYNGGNNAWVSFAKMSWYPDGH